MSSLSTQPISVSAIAQKYQVNVGKPHFPLNTLRLVYLIFAESIAAHNSDHVQARTQDILSIIPKIQALTDARSTHRSEQAELSLQSEWAAVQPALEDLYQIIDTPSVRQSMETVFSYVFPLQDTLLMSLYSDLASGKKFSMQDVMSIFHIRSMDSIVYSSLVGAIIRKHAEAADLPVNFQLALNYKLNALYQLNDLVDALVYAKDDLESQNFSPFEIIKKVATDATEARQLIITVANTFEQRIANFPLGEQTESLITDFGHQLIGVIGGGAAA